ncbi:MAG: VWA domain-containing protein [Candidatus Schekmanbacteria bacterium]|nr:VWA domain-containing protein [Candidatus Schekmanbacteria bacterium]
MGFFNPWGFVFASLLAPIIWFYLWREKKHVLHVSSIIPWRYLSIDQTFEAQKFRIDWQMVLQLLMVLLGTLALTRTFWLRNVDVEYQVIIIDSSASMAAVHKDGRSSLEIAKEKALELVNQSGPNLRTALIEVAGDAKRLADFNTEKPELVKTIQAIQPKEERTNTQAGMGMAHSLLRDYPGGRVFLLSDNREWVSEDDTLAKNLTHIDVNDDGDNLAITGLDCYRGIYAGEERTAFIRVANFSPREKKTWLNVWLNDESIHRTQMTLAPNAYQNYPLKIRNTRGILKAELEADDVLSLDNVAYLKLEEGGSYPVLLVTPSDQAEQDFARLAQATGRIHFRRIRPEEFSPELLPDYRLAIFHQSAPTRLLPIDSIFICAPNGHELWKTMEEPVSAPNILDWDREHPTLKYLDFLDKLIIKEAMDTRLPEWGNLLIGTSQFPLAFWGEEDGFRQLVFNFDLMPMLFTENQDLRAIILLLNSIDWLASAEYKGDRIKTGEPYTLKFPQVLKEVTVINPRNEKEIFHPGKKVFNYDKTGYIGVYQVRAEDAQGSINNYSFVANLLAEDEANLESHGRPIQDKAAAAAKKKPGGPNKTPYELWRFLLLAGMVCLLAEWWLYFKA